MEQREVQKLIDTHIAEWEEDTSRVIYRIVGIMSVLLFLFFVFGCCTMLSDSDPAGVKVERKK